MFKDFLFRTFQFPINKHEDLSKMWQKFSKAYYDDEIMHKCYRS